MNKKKIIALILGAVGAKLLICQMVRGHRKIKELEENQVELSLLQDDFNKEVLEEFQSVKEEIGAVYEHLETLALETKKESGPTLD